MGAGRGCVGCHILASNKALPEGVVVPPTGLEPAAERSESAAQVQSQQPVDLRLSGR